MGRAMIVLNTKADRAEAVRWVNLGPQGTRVSFAGPQRTIPQNKKMWPCLTDISRQAVLNGRKYTPDAWKKIFIDALSDDMGSSMEFLPKLDGTGYFPAGHSSSDLSKDEMGDLLTLILAWGDTNEVVFSERPEQ